jgi:hypothetical protein
MVMAFIKAQIGPPNVKEKEKDKDIFTVQYFDEHGNMTIRSEGSVTWRCNNPAAMLDSPYSTSKDRRCIGTAGNAKYKYAVYPDYETGHEALIVMLKGSKYFHLTLREASLRYVKEDPDHIHKIVKLSKLNPDRTIKSLDAKEFEIYWGAIEENEGWIVGREVFVDKWYITGVHRKHGVIYEYRIQKNGSDIWLSKLEAISMAVSHQLHAIVVHMKNGACYLRAEYRTKPFSSLIV